MEAIAAGSIVSARVVLLVSPRSPRVAQEPTSREIVGTVVAMVDNAT